MRRRKKGFHLITKRVDFNPIFLQNGICFQRLSSERAYFHAEMHPLRINRNPVSIVWERKEEKYCIYAAMRKGSRKIVKNYFLRLSKWKALNFVIYLRTHKKGGAQKARYLKSMPMSHAVVCERYYVVIKIECYVCLEWKSSLSSAYYENLFIGKFLKIGIVTKCMRKFQFGVFF